MEKGAPTLRLGQEIVFDFTGAKNITDLTTNMSGVVCSDDLAWTVSDEGRSFESFTRTSAGYSFSQQFSLTSFFPRLPGGHEADLESIDLFDGRIWLCGSHCRVRAKPDRSQALAPGIRSRASRHLLGSIRLNPQGVPIEES